MPKLSKIQKKAKELQKVESSLDGLRTVRDMVALRIEKIDSSDPTTVKDFKDLSTLYLQYSKEIVKLEGLFPDEVDEGLEEDDELRARYGG